METKTIKRTTTEKEQQHPPFYPMVVTMLTMEVMIRHGWD